MKTNPTLNRFFEIIPGAASWVLLLSPVWLGVIFPVGAVFLLSFLLAFWVVRALMHFIGCMIGYARYLREKKINWLELSKSLPGFDELFHLIVIPAVNEPYEVLRGSFESIANLQYPKDRIFVAFSVEQKHALRVLADIEKFRKEFGDRLPVVWTFVHPRGIEGEVVGAAANRSWAVKQAEEKLKSLGVDLDKVLVTTIDADMRFDKQFFARLAYEVLIDPEPYDHFYQTAVYLFTNNIWSVPPLMRVQASSLTLAILSSWVIEPYRKDTFSSYSLFLKTLKEVGYWDPALGVDDTPLFWRIFIKKDGKFSGRHFYIPVSADAVEAESFVKSHIAQYKQLLRWGWGVIVFPIALEGFLRSKRIPIKEKLFRLYFLLEQAAVWPTVAFLLSFGIFLLSKVNPVINKSAVSFYLPQVFATFLSLTLVFLIPLTYISRKLNGMPPTTWGWWKHVLLWFEGPLVLVNLLTYNFFPFLEAETRLMLGKRLEFWTTPKLRKK